MFGSGLFLILRLMRGFPVDEAQIKPPPAEAEQAVILLGGHRPLQAAVRPEGTAP